MQIPINEYIDIVGDKPQCSLSGAGKLIATKIGEIKSGLQGCKVNIKDQKILDTLSGFSQLVIGNKVAKSLRNANNFIDAQLGTERFQQVTKPEQTPVATVTQTTVQPVTPVTPTTPTTPSTPATPETPKIAVVPTPSEKHVEIITVEPRRSRRRMCGSRTCNFFLFVAIIIAIYFMYKKYNEKKQ